MARIDRQREMDLESPTLVEGLPGVGLVGKIATDHLVESFEMDYYAACYCDGLPEVAVYEADERTFRPPVRLYADEERDLLALQSDVPVSPEAATEFATCLVGWFGEHDITPICLSGLPQEKDDVPKLYGIGTGAGADRLDEHGIDRPDENGLIRGPTGALLAEAGRLGIDSVGLVVQASAQFPDPESARALLVKAIEPLAGVDIDTQPLIERAEEIATARERLAKQMQEADDESTQAQPLGMYQ